MKSKDSLRPVKIIRKQKNLKGFFHRFVYIISEGRSETKVLVELDNGMLRLYELYFVQFTDRVPSEGLDSTRESSDDFITPKNFFENKF